MVNSIKSSSKIKNYNWNSWVTVNLHDLTPTVNILLPLLENCSSSPCLPQSSRFMSRSIFAALHGPTKPHSMYWSVLTNSPNLSKKLTFHMRIGPLVLFYLLWNPVIFSVGPPRIQALLQARHTQLVETIHCQECNVKKYTNRLTKLDFKKSSSK